MEGTRAVKFLFACGGTGGHIFPAIAVAEELKRRGAHEIVYVCGKKDIENAIFSVVRAERRVSIDSAPYRGRRSFFDLRFYASLLAGFAQAGRLLSSERPDAVVGFGGFYSFPVLGMARLRGVPSILHEQNVLPGRANRVLARWVDSVALSFEATRRTLSGRRRTVVTGNPIRASIERECRAEALRTFGFSPEKKTLLVLGGSQGAESINVRFGEALSLLDGSAKQSLQVLHLCGKMPTHEAEAICRRIGVAAKAYSFFDRMDLAYGAADLCLGRAGATFLAEIRAKRLPAVLVPYPFGDGHQRANAHAFAEVADARVIEQEDLTAQSLAEALLFYLNKVENPSGRVNLESGSARKKTVRNSREDLADFILQTAEKK